MFGLFQADLPIGHRLWLTLLAIVVGGSIAATPLAEVASDPVSFGVNLLLLFGQATLVTISYLFLPSLVLGSIEFEIKRREDKNRSEFFLETEDYDPLFARAMNFLTLVGYVIAVCWIAHGHFAAGLGSLGLALFLFAELLTQWQDVYLRGYEYIELRRVNDTIKARIIREENVKEYKVHKDWAVLHANLGDNTWELLEFSKTFSLSRRNYRKGLIPQRWLRSLPRPLRSLFGKRSVRHRKP